MPFMFRPHSFCLFWNRVPEGKSMSLVWFAICISLCSTGSFFPLVLEICWGLPWLKIHPDMAKPFNCHPLLSSVAGTNVLKELFTVPPSLSSLAPIHREVWFLPPGWLHEHCSLEGYKRKKCDVVFSACRTQFCADPPCLLSCFLFPQILWFCFL